MKKTKALVAGGLALVSILTFSGGVHAQTGTGPNPYRDCGIGAALFPNVNWAAVTSNVIWDVGTTAVISATASPETCQGQNVVAAAFIYETFDSLTEETAKGEGEHVATLFNILEVSEEQRADVLMSVRSAMSLHVDNSSFSALSKVDKAETFYFSVIDSLKS